MSSSDNMPLSQLAASLMDADDMPSPAMQKQSHAHADKSEGCAHSWYAFVFYFLVIALVLYFVFFALRPSFVLKQEDDSRSFSRSEDSADEIDNGRLLGAAVVGALLLIFIFWLFSFFAGSW